MRCASASASCDLIVSLSNCIRFQRTERLVGVKVRRAADHAGQASHLSPSSKALPRGSCRVPDSDELSHPDRKVIYDLGAGVSDVEAIVPVQLPELSGAFAAGRAVKEHKLGHLSMPRDRKMLELMSSPRPFAVEGRTVAIWGDGNIGAAAAPHRVGHQRRVAGVIR